MGDLAAESDRIAALTVPCPHCHTPAGRPCRRPFDGHELVHLPAHLDRIAAGYANERKKRYRDRRHP